jgi:PEGA domain
LRAADVAAAAGSLAFQKLSRGARATLRDWLAPLKPKDQEGHALDDLMGLCLVPVAAQDGGRTFTVSQMIPIGQPGDGRSALRVARDPRAARTSAPIEIQTFDPPPLTTGQKIGRAARWAAATVVVATAATFTAWRPGSTSHGAAGAGAEMATMAATVATSPVVTPGTPAALRQATRRNALTERAIVVSPPGPAVAAAPHVAARPTDSPTSPRRARRVADRSEAKGFASASAAPSPTAALARGWLRVGGAGFFGGQVTVDGEAVGFAPLERALPVGPHSITVTSPASGQTLVRRTIHVGGYHTRVKPLSLLR